MNCVYHDELEANFTCSECGSNICKECAVDNNGKIICLQCARNKGIPIIKNTNNYNYNNNTGRDINYMDNNRRRYSVFWATVFSFIPGAGHMYLDVMNRGLQLMLAFFGIIAISNLFYSANFLTIFSIIVWFYSFFDCYHIRKKLERGEDVTKELVFNLDFKKINIKHIGIGFVGVGGLVLLDEILRQLMFESNRVILNSQTIRILRNATFPVVLIVIGLIILNKAKKNISE